MDTNFNLYKDLINNFHAHDKCTRERLALIEPMAASMKSGSIQRLLESWFLILLEILVWVLVVISLLAIVFTDRVYPFSFLHKLSFNNTIALETYGEKDFEMLYLGTKALFGIIALLLFIITRMVASVRKKNKILGIATRSMKKIGEMTLKDKTHIETLYNRYPYDLPKTQDSIIVGNVTAVTPPHDDQVL